MNGFKYVVLKISISHPIMPTILFFCCFSYLMASAQSQECKLIPSEFDALYYVNAEDVKCLARTTDNKNLVIYTFGNWCTPCKLHLPRVLELADKYDIDLYILLIENFSSPGRINTSINFLKESGGNKKLIALKQEEYGKKMRKQYKQFITEVTPPGFKNIDCMSKIIVYDKNGEVVMVTSYEDNEGNDWRDNSKEIKEKVIPHLSPISN